VPTSKLLSDIADSRRSNDISLGIAEEGDRVAKEYMMSDSFTGKGFPGRRGASGEGWPGGGVWEAMEHLRGQFERKVGARMGRGDVRAAVIALLAEAPMHGYQIIHEIEERSGGAWKPSPGSVYPTLQLLADEGIIEAKESNGRKTYSLTDEGRLVADAAAEESAPWEAQSGRDGMKTGALPKAGVELAHAAAQVARSGTAEQQKQAVEVLDEARRKLYSILAQE
jgi:DNA-binding PadR family transcriptional regulator